MPWSQLSPMDQKTQFIANYLRQSLSVTELCEHYGIGCARAGTSGLSATSARVPPAWPNAPDARRCARPRPPRGSCRRSLERGSAILPGARRSSWRSCPGAIPMGSTICDVLDRHGLVRKARTRRRVGHPGKPSTAMSVPNGIWCADFKGQFKTRDGVYCYPLTVTRLASSQTVPAMDRSITKAKYGVGVFHA